MKISIIVPNYNSPIVIKTIESILFQATKHYFEIIVVGVDEYGLIRENKKVKFIDTKTKCPPARARNIGAEYSEGEFLVFIDADCIAPKFWLNKIMRPFDDPKIVAVGGGVNFRSDNYWTVADNLSMFYLFLHTKQARYEKHLPSLNLSIRKEIFFSVGGFNEKYPLPSGEDFELTAKISQIGYIYFFPDAWVLHSPPRTNIKMIVKHSYYQGRYSTKIDKSNNGINYFFFRNHLVLLLFSIPLSILVTIKIFLQKHSIKYFYTFPAIFISKIFWCLGASESIKQSKIYEKDY